MKIMTTNKNSETMKALKTVALLDLTYTIQDNWTQVPVSSRDLNVTIGDDTYLMFKSALSVRGSVVFDAMNELDTDEAGIIDLYENGYIITKLLKSFIDRFDNSHDYETKNTAIAGLIHFMQKTAL